MTKGESVNSMKNTDLILKGGQLWLWKNKWFIILMTNNTSKAMTKQHKTYYGKNREKINRYLKSSISII